MNLIHVSPMNYPCVFLWCWKCCWTCYKKIIISSIDTAKTDVHPRDGGAHDVHLGSVGAWRDEGLPGRMARICGWSGYEIDSRKELVIDTFQSWNTVCRKIPHTSSWWYISTSDLHHDGVFFRFFPWTVSKFRGLTWWCSHFPMLSMRTPLGPPRPLRRPVASPAEGSQPWCDSRPHHPRPCRTSAPPGFSKMVETPRGIHGNIDGILHGNFHGNIDGIFHGKIYL